MFLRAFAIFPQTRVLRSPVDNPPIIRSPHHIPLVYHVPQSPHQTQLHRYLIRAQAVSKRDPVDETTFCFCGLFRLLALVVFGRYNNNIMYSRVWNFSTFTPQNGLSKYTAVASCCPREDVGPISVQHGGYPIHRLPHFFSAPANIARFKRRLFLAIRIDRFCECVLFQ